MASCPNCGAEIHNLKVYTERKDVMSLGVNNKPKYDEVTDYLHVQYECPECDEVIEEIENDEEAATKFLAG